MKAKIIFLLVLLAAFCAVGWLELDSTCTTDTDCECAEDCLE